MQFLILFQYFKCVGWINGIGNQKKGAKKFQYFKCVGWIGGKKKLLKG